MEPTYAVAAHWHGPFNEPALAAWAGEIRGRLAAPGVSVGMVFLSPDFFDHARETLEILRVHARIPLLVGCSSQGLIAGGREHEREAGLALALYHLPGAELSAVRFTGEQVGRCETAADWHRWNGIAPDQTNGWMVFADPFHLDLEQWLAQWNEAYAPLPILGGLASGDVAGNGTQVYLNGDVFSEGGVALSVGGRVRPVGVTSQGCTPIGETWTITHAERNIIHQIANRPAYQVLVETFEKLSPADQQQARGNLFIGLVINEYLEEFHRGDFLIRNLLGADPVSGSIAVGALPRLGQTLQFQRRDARAATEDFQELLTRTRAALGTQPVYGGVLCCCNGRGHGLFGEPDHDARLVQQHLGPLGLAGFFCNGEIGPVGQRSFLHGYTASLALFAGK